MTSAAFDFAPLLPAGLPAPAARWTGLAKYSFVGGNNDPDGVPVEGLIDAEMWGEAKAREEENRDVLGEASQNWALVENFLRQGPS